MFGISRTYIYFSAKRLDKVFPGWYNLIDTQELFMMDNRCILGQIGSYNQKDFGWAADKFYGMKILPKLGKIGKWIDEGLDLDCHSLTKRIGALLVMLAIVCIIFTPLFIPNFCMGKRHWVRQINKRRLRDEYKSIKDTMKSQISTMEMSEV